MCGIAGYVTARGEAWPGALERMTGVIAHRGPDEHGYYSDSFAHLGHRRLSIIDLATGQQPMTSESGRLRIIYNGEVFNHAALRPDLEKAGHRYETRCDTETILHAYEEYGADCVSRLRGMFAFVIWDPDRRRLFCARDRLGKKPFYYYFDGRLFAFASEIKALLQHPAISARFDPAQLPEYLAFGYLSGAETMFAGIRKLMPGHVAEVSVEDGALQFRATRYWDLPAAAPERDGDETAWVAECRRRLEETVRMRLMSDVPLGMFLSGGVDSSAIAALMKRQFDGPVKTFSVGYAEAAYSELAYARETARRLNTDHHEISVSRDDFFAALPRLVWHEDEPIVWPSSVSLYFVSRLAAEQVKVVLTGEGSDELFAGYGRYSLYRRNMAALRGYGLLPGALRRRIRGFVASSGLLSGSLRRKLQHTVVGCAEGLDALYLDNFYSAFSGAAQQSLLRHPGGPAAPYAAFYSYWNERPDFGLLSRMLYADQKTYLVELLMKQDQMSMATSIESRVPFLDHEFAEFAARVPESLKLRGGTGKYILKRAVADLVPREVLTRRKLGFPTPLRAWLAGPSAAALLEPLRSPRGLLAEHLDPAALSALLDRHAAGAEDATDRIWRLLNLHLWGEIFLSGNGIPEPGGSSGALAASPAR